MEPEDSFTVRMGLFFLVMGGGAFLLFVVSDIADQVDFDYLFVSAVLLLIGWSMRRTKPPPPSSGRFARIKNWNQKRKEKKAEKLKKKEEEKKK